MTAEALKLPILARRRIRAGAALWLLGCALLIVFTLSVGHGAHAISLGRMIEIIAAQLGLLSSAPGDAVDEVVLLSIRLPRAILGVLVGASLAVSGAALQGLFRNPLADPSLIGVSMGSAAFAGAMIVLGGAIATWVPAGVIGHLLPVAAFLGGLLTTIVVYAVSNRGGRTDVPTMLLAGVALNAIAAAAVGLLIFLSTEQQLRDLSFWTLGTLGGASWERLAVAGPLMLGPVFALPVLSRQLNALLLGETEALHLGFEVERLKRLIVVLSALGVGAAVAVCGAIGFVGLVVPHLIRLALGPDHRILLPASVLLGATLILVADLLARSVVLPAELPIGILTSGIGGPFFLWLLIRGRDRGAW